MPLLDFYIMVDWSGGARRRGGRSDTIWIAHGLRTANGPLTSSPHSRTEAVDLIHTLLEKEIKSKRRVLLCFDFAYGYRFCPRAPGRNWAIGSRFAVDHRLAILERAP